MQQMQLFFVLLSHGIVFTFATGNHDPRRLNNPVVPFALQPLQWGSVQPMGWLREWATALTKGSGSPKCSAFAQYRPNNHSVDGWRGGRPNFGGFWDEDSAYYIDGIARLGLVMHNQALLDRAKMDFEYVIDNPDNFNATFKGDSVEGWVRSIYSRGMLAYYDGTGDRKVLDFLNHSFSSYRAVDSIRPTDSQVGNQMHQGSRSMTQMESLLETFAYGGSSKLVHTAVDLMSTRSTNGGYEFMQQLLRQGCVALKGSAINGSGDAQGDGGCESHAHGVTYNEVSKLFAMGYSYTGNRSHLQASLTAYELLSKFDMQVYGVNSADEDMNGVGPNAATETCDVSDFIYSNAWLLRITGQSRFGDHLERAFFNAAPGAVNRTFSGHVYFQAPNLVPDLQKEFGGDRFNEQFWHAPPCCTGNQVRILPNFIHHTWFGTTESKAPDGIASRPSGLAVTMYAPTHVTSRVGDGRPGHTAGVVNITALTSYPFGDGSFSYNIVVVSSSSASSTVIFPLSLRIPEWTKLSNMMATFNGKPYTLFHDTTLPGFARVDVSCVKHCTLKLWLKMTIQTRTGVTVWNNWSSDVHSHVVTWADINATSTPRHLRNVGQLATHGRARVYAREHIHAHSGSGLGAGHTTVVPDLPFCYVNRGPILFALPLEVGSVHGSLPPGLTLARLGDDTARVASHACVLQRSMGCYKEISEGSRQLPYAAYLGNALTRDKCALACAHWCQESQPSNHNCLAGVEGRKGNQCRCGHSIAEPMQRFPPGGANCQVKCSGDVKNTCGGDWEIDIFNITCARPLPPNPFGPTPHPSPSPLPSVAEWRFALDCDASKMTVSTKSMISPFDWPLDSPVTISAQAQPFDDWSSVWELPPGPVVRTSASTRLTLVPYGSAKVYKLSMFPFVDS